MEAIVLAGGFGTRLQSVVRDVPKPMADIVGKPFLVYILEYLLKNNITKVVLSVGYKKELIKKYFGVKYKELNIVYSSEEVPLGTGGAIKQALTFTHGRNIIVLNGDTLFEVNLNNLMQNHIEKNADITLALKKMYDFDRYGKVLLQKNRIMGFTEKEFTSSGFINGGVYIIQRELFKRYKRKFSFEHDFLEANFLQLNIFGFIESNYFIDIGIPEDYQKAIYDFSDKKALLLDRDGIINIDMGYVYKRKDFKFVDGIFEVCKYYQNQDYLIFIVTNQAGIARGYYTEDDFHVLTNWMISEFFKNDIKIQEVFYCPHHPTEGKNDYLQNCLCRKPKAKMLLDIQSKYKISLKNSILIGDKKSDKQSGINAGVDTNILIKSKYQQDYDFTSLKEYLQHLKEGEIS